MYRAWDCWAGRVARFPAQKMLDSDGAKLKVPHMGWNEVHQTLEHPLWQGIPPGSRFYFVHSYYPVPSDRDLIAGYSLYPFAFTCAVARSNLFAVQFHPEKSQAAGCGCCRISCIGMVHTSAPPACGRAGDRGLTQSG
jgi:glutamine amidotransferase